MSKSRVRVIAKAGEEYGVYLQGKPSLKVNLGDVFIEIPNDEELQDWAPFWNKVDELREAAKK